MYFILQSEINSKNGVFCPHCNAYEVKLLDKKEFYTKYVCWNKNCEKYNVAFIGINMLISREFKIDYRCDNCRSKLTRDFHFYDKDKLCLTFKCTNEDCKIKPKPLIYNLSKNRWEQNLPKFRDIKKDRYFKKVKPSFNNINDLAAYLLMREKRALSAIEMYRICYHENLLNTKDGMSWPMIGTVLSRDIKQKKEYSKFIEIKQGVFDLRKRFQTVKEKDQFDILKEEYDWVSFEPVSLVIYKNEQIIIKKSLNFLIPEISAYIKGMDVDEKREFFITDGFLWRRKLNLLNINNNNKKFRFFNYIKNNFPYFNYKNANIELIIDLNKDEIILQKRNALFTNLQRVLFSSYKYIYKDLTIEVAKYIIKDDLIKAKFKNNRKVKFTNNKKELRDISNYSKIEPLETIDYSYDNFYLKIRKISQKNKIKIINIARTEFFNERLNFFKCKCGKVFLNPEYLFKHIVNSSECLNKFIVDDFKKKKINTKKILTEGIPENNSSISKQISNHTQVIIITNEKILDILQHNWHNLNELISKLDVKDELDIRYLKLKLKKLEKKRKIIVKNEKGVIFWKSNNILWI